jgi:hypothetical protein
VVASFKTWLGKQQGRSDSVGSVAKFVASDTSVPDAKLRVMVKYLKEHGATKFIISGLEAAHTEWEAKRSPQVPESGPVT